MEKVQRPVIILMGVSGSGKTTVGNLLSNRIGIPFFDGDDFHPVSNIEKMKNGFPLNDDDRGPWLVKLAAKIAEWRNDTGAILACSALKESYRKLLVGNNLSKIYFFHLVGKIELISERLKSRSGHFFDHKMLESQFNILEPPHYALEIDVHLSPNQISELIRKYIFEERAKTNE